MSNLQGGPAQPVYIISDADLVENGGNFKVVGKTAIPLSMGDGELNPSFAGWLATSASGGALGTAAYAATGDFDAAGAAGVVQTTLDAMPGITRLGEGIAAGATSATLRTTPGTELRGVQFVIVSAFTTDAEICLVQSDGTIKQYGAGVFANNHSAGSAVVAVDKGINVKWFGAKGNGTTDDTTAIQAAFDAMLTGLGLWGGYLYFPPGEYLISRTIEIIRYSGVIAGAGGWNNAPTYGTYGSLGTTLRWAVGAGAKPMLQIRDSRNVTISQFKFQGASLSANPADTPTAAINFNYVTGDNKGTNAKLFVDRCLIGTYPWTSGADDHVVDVGILFDGNNGNNDEFVIEKCAINNCTDSGIKIVNSQSTWNSIKETLIDSCPIGIYVGADTATYNVHFNNCDVDYNVQTAFSVWAYQYQSENAKQFATMGNSVRFHVFGGDLNVNALTSDGFSVTTCQRNLITLRGIDFDLTLPGGIAIVHMSSAIGTDYHGTLIIEDCTGIDPTTDLDIIPSGTGHTRTIYFRDTHYWFRNYLQADSNDDTIDIYRFDLPVVGANKPPRKLEHLQLVWVQQNVVGSGTSSTQVGTYLDLQSGTTGNSQVCRYVNTNNLMLNHTIYGFNWGARIEISSFCSVITSNTEGVFRGIFGKLTTESFGKPSSGNYVGYTVNDSTLTETFVCVAGTVTNLTTVSTPIQTNGSLIQIVSDNGNVSFFVDGVKVSSTTSGPTANATGTILYEINNGATAANYRIRTYSQSKGW